MIVKSITFLTTGLLLSGVAFADQSFTAYGRVVHSTPVYKTIEVERKNHRCRDKHHSHSGYSNSGYRTDRYRVGSSKHGKRNSHEYQQYERPNPGHHRCNSRRHYKTKRILKGFDVTYRYKGDTFHTFTKFNPGRRIALNISISPQFY